MNFESNQAEQLATNNLDFGQALRYLKQGKLVQRAGWNGKDMFIFIRPEDELPVEMVVHNVKSLPQSVKNYLADRFKGNYTKASDKSPFTIKFTSYLCMKAADGSIVNGWLASQTDMLSSDWQIVE